MASRLLQVAKSRVSFGFGCANHWLADSIFPAQFTVKNVIYFSDIFHWKNGEFFKAFLLLFNFLLSFSPQTGKVVAKFWVFHLVSSWKIDGKQTTFFTENSAENFEFSNQWTGHIFHQKPRSLITPANRFRLDSCRVFKWIVMGRKPMNCTPPVGHEATRLSCSTSWVVIHSEIPRSYTKFCWYSLKTLSVLDLDLYKLCVDILDKQNRYVEYKEMDQTWQLVYNLAKISNHRYY
jgi:hypothetical protein